MASRRIIGNADILGNLKINGKYALRSLNGVPADSAGKITYQYYDKAEVNQMFDMLPVSRVGDQDYLPMSINGTFEGASSFSFAKIMQPCIIENDGTGVILRAGTNGSSYGYYYTYIKNIKHCHIILLILYILTFYYSIGIILTIDMILTGKR